MRTGNKPECSTPSRELRQPGDGCGGATVVVVAGGWWSDSMHDESPIVPGQRWQGKNNLPSTDFNEISAVFSYHASPCRRLTCSRFKASVAGVFLR